MAQISFTVPNALMPKLQEAFLAMTGKQPRDAIIDYAREVYRAYQVDRAREQAAQQAAAGADSESAGVV